MKYIGVGRRCVALLIDAMLVFLGLGIPVAAMTGNVSAQAGNFEFRLEGAPALALCGLWFAYYIVMEAILGATVGKLLVGVRVRTTDGKRIGWMASLARNLLRTVDGAFGLVGPILIWTSPLRQRLGDRAASTVVVQAS